MMRRLSDFISCQQKVLRHRGWLSLLQMTGQTHLDRDRRDGWAAKSTNHTCKDLSSVPSAHI
ncbi:rCG26504 [Rattus norvegicus]|uniref:RCG26504 n=1 Tax=Rattus norvegicus TaxID=10116 RepID=A6HNT0_RAT|nr:rCG26504 [Rattus norvegicus]